MLDRTHRFAQAIASGALVVFLFIFWMYMGVTGIGLSPSEYACTLNSILPLASLDLSALRIRSVQ